MVAALSTAQTTVPASELVSADDIASWLGIDRSVVFRLVSKGIIPRIRRGKYDLRDSVRRAYAHLAEVAAGRGGEDAGATLTAERARLARAQAVQVETKNRVASGELVNAEEASGAWVREIVALRSTMLRLPDDIAMELHHLTKHDLAVIDRLLRATMTEIAHRPLQDVAEHG